MFDLKDNHNYDEFDKENDKYALTYEQHKINMILEWLDKPIVRQHTRWLDGYNLAKQEIKNIIAHGKD